MGLLGSIGGSDIAGGALVAGGIGLAGAVMADGPEHTQYRDPGLDIAQNYYGGYAGGAQDMTKQGLSGAGKATNMANWANIQSQYAGLRDPRARENQQLSNYEAGGRGVLGAATSLAAQAAEGKTPSEAAYLMQSGLNRAIANQSALTGSVRGANAMALAQGNQGANVANLQQQAYNDAGALRAKEMAEARSLYGNLAGNLRAGDMSRLNAGNQMSQFNADLNDRYALGMANAGNAASNTGLGWYSASMDPMKQQLAADDRYRSDAINLYSSQQDRDATKLQNIANESNDWSRGIIGFGGNMMGIGGSMIGGTTANFNQAAPGTILQTPDGKTVSNGVPI